jgi:serine/threonine protein kinase
MAGHDDPCGTQDLHRPDGIGWMTLRVDGFTDVTPLAGGGFGSVYRATRASTGGVVALKVLDRAHGDDDDLLERRLRREIAALVALKGHPNVVQVEQVVTTVNGPAIVMEFMARGSVLDVDDPGRMKPQRVAFIGAAAASGLQAAHEVGIVHRDVKPQNVLVNSFGTVKLCDFGIAAIQKSAEFQAHTSALSIRYASPEELDGDPHIGTPTDIYSLGASMFHLMYGEPPSFRGGRGADPSLTRSRRGEDAVRDTVSRIIERCLAEDPARRPSANECFGLLSTSSGGVAPERKAATVTRHVRRPDPDDVTAERPVGVRRRSAHVSAELSGPPASAPSTERAPRRRDDVSAAPVLPTSSDETWWQ